MFSCLHNVYGFYEWFALASHGEGAEISVLFRSIIVKEDTLSSSNSLAATKKWFVVINLMIMTRERSFHDQRANTHKKIMSWCCSKAHPNHAPSSLLRGRKKDPKIYASHNFHFSRLCSRKKLWRREKLTTNKLWNGIDIVCKATFYNVVVRSSSHVRQTQIFTLSLTAN